MNKILISLSLMMVICAAYAAQIYKWIDDQGTIHFSDIPHEGVEVIIIPNTQSFSTPTPPPIHSQPMENNPVKLKRAYTKIVIIQPENGATIRNKQGFVGVTAQVEPELFPGDKLQLLYDGVILGEPQKNPVFEIKGMYRGSHTLAVNAVNADGKVIESSDPTTIYVFRPRVGMVPGTRVH